MLRNGYFDTRVLSLEYNRSSTDAAERNSSSADAAELNHKLIDAHTTEAVAAGMSV